MWNEEQTSALSDVRYINFDPGLHVRRAVNLMIDEVTELAPYDSFIRVSFRQLSNMILGECEIVSHIGSFLSESNGDGMLAVVNNINQNLKEQLNDWKSKRSKTFLRAQ